MRAFGLSSWIWNNAWKTALLLAGFPFLLVLICCTPPPRAAYRDWVEPAF